MSYSFYSAINECMRLFREYWTGLYAEATSGSQNVPTTHEAVCFLPLPALPICKRHPCGLNQGSHGATLVRGGWKRFSNVPGPQGKVYEP